MCVCRRVHTDSHLRLFAVHRIESVTGDDPSPRYATIRFCGVLASNAPDNSVCVCVCVCACVGWCSRCGSHGRRHTRRRAQMLALGYPHRGERWLLDTHASTLVVACNSLLSLSGAPALSPSLALSLSGAPSLPLWLCPSPTVSESARARRAQDPGLLQQWPRMRWT